MGSMKTYKDLEKELIERKALDFQQRRKLALRMKKMAKSGAFKMKVKRAKTKFASPERLEKRARKQAKMMVIKKMLGPGINYNELPIQKRAQIDQKVVAKKGPLINKIAKKLVLVNKKKEAQRLKDFRKSQQEKD